MVELDSSRVSAANEYDVELNTTLSYKRDFVYHVNTIAFTDEKSHLY